MKSMEIKTYGAEVLRTRAEAVVDFGLELEDFAGRMKSIMISERGVGLAAPQVGICKRIIVFYTDPENSPKIQAMVNPEIIASSDESEKMEEGCLSIPDIRGDVQRALEVEVKYQTLEGKEQRCRFYNLPARIIQHEVDHINKILFIDHLSFAKKAMIRGKLRKLSRKSASKG
ncbi:MAG: peptide deformylase [Candidatus Krumholzibacteriota bacterium]|nr:peptide deformylase [Candidatus Krumholzibacteriota bacterium]